MALRGILARAFPVAHYIGDHTVLLRTWFGQVLYVDARDESIGPHLMLDGVWEKHVTRAYLRLLSRGSRVIEVGANVGYFTTLAAERVGPGGRIYAFEANPAVAKLLQRAIRVNGQGGWCTVVQKAVADRVGETRFYAMRREQGNSTLRDLKEATLVKLGDDVVESIVPVISLDAFLEHEPGHIDVVKIDAEGAEPLIFKGMSTLLAQNPRLTIVMEFSYYMLADAEAGPLGFLDQIRGQGFRIFQIEPSGRLRLSSNDEVLDARYCELVLQRA